MAHFLCRCGVSYSIATEGRENEAEIIPGIALPKFYDEVRSAFQSAVDDEHFRRLLVAVVVERRKPAPVGYECASCGRLAIVTQGKATLWFVREVQPGAAMDGSIRSLATFATTHLEPLELLGAQKRVCTPRSSFTPLRFQVDAQLLNL
jgi:hypothetical protein